MYPFPLLNASSAAAVHSVAYWSSPQRTDAFGLHTKLGYSQQPWAYMSSDVGHVHLAQGNHSGALRVLRAMVDNASPTLGTYEEFETGPWRSDTASPKRSWGGIPDLWFTSEVLNLMRDVVLLELPDSARGVSLFHGAPPAWRTGDALSMRRMPTRLGVSISADTAWGARASRIALVIDGASAALRRVELHVGRCANVSVRLANSSSPRPVPPLASCEGGVAVLTIGEDMPRGHAVELTVAVIHS